MTLEKINKYSDYLDIVEHFGGKESTSNNYLQSSAESLILKDKLYAVKGEKNVFILVKNDGFYRAYYYINDFSEIISLPNHPISTEIIYRGHSGEPTNEIEYLLECGFKCHLLRDQYSGIYKNLSLSSPLSDKISISPSSSIEDVEKAFSLFNRVFDKFTGDYISPDLYPSLLENGDIYIAKNEENKFLGALHRTIAGNVAWLSHIAVKENARGKNVGSSLLSYFIEKNKTSEKARYMFWVQHENIPAIEMYRSKGFVYAGKSSLSMLKLK